MDEYKEAYRSTTHFIACANPFTVAQQFALARKKPKRWIEMKTKHVQAFAALPAAITQYVVLCRGAPGSGEQASTSNKCVCLQFVLCTACFAPSAPYKSA